MIDNVNLELDPSYVPTFDIDLIQFFDISVDPSNTDEVTSLLEMLNLMKTLCGIVIIVSVSSMLFELFGVVFSSWSMEIQSLHVEKEKKSERIKKKITQWKESREPSPPKNRFQAVSMNIGKKKRWF